MTTLETIKQLRAQTGISIAACKGALDEAGNFDGAVKILRANGLKKLESVVCGSEGLISSYVHHNGQVAVLVEVSTQTDFAARRPEVAEFAKNVAMQIASVNPRFITSDDVPADELALEAESIRKRYLKAKPEIFEQRILPGALKAFYKENCLLEQVFVKDSKKYVKDLLAELVSKLDESVSIKRFVRYQVGE